MTKPFTEQLTTLFVVSAILLLVIGSGVTKAVADKPDLVLTCQVAKVTAAGNRAECLAKQEIETLRGRTPNSALCEDNFDTAIATADAKAAAQGAACRYVDNGDGTITDLNTLLMWEKKFAGSVDAT